MNTSASPLEEDSDDGTSLTRCIAIATGPARKLWPSFFNTASCVFNKLISREKKIRKQTGSLRSQMNHEFLYVRQEVQPEHEERERCLLEMADRARK